MAKKKVSHAHLEKPSENALDSVKPQKPEAQTNMESDSSEKLENLKTLNLRLLKETSDSRRQIESLLHDKESLEAQLTRSKSEAEVLGSEVAMLTDKVADLELERNVLSAFVSEQYEVLEKSANVLESKVSELRSVVEEKEGKIEFLSGKLSETEGLLGKERDLASRVSVERDDLAEKLGMQVKVCEGLKMSMVELEERKRRVEDEMDQLHTSFDGLVKENDVLRMRMEVVKNEKYSVETSLVESNKLVDRLKEEINRVVGEKAEVEEKKNMETNLRQELENVVSGLNEMVSGLKKEEKRLQTCVVELERQCVNGEEEREEMDREINHLVEKNKAVQEIFKELVNEKALIEENLGKVLRELDAERLKIQEMVDAKTMLLEEKNVLDGQVSELRHLVAELRGAVSELKEADSINVLKIKNFESELGDYNCKLELVSAERDEAKHDLEQEKENASKLMENIVKLENEIKKKVNAAEEFKAQNASVHAEKIELESQCKKLTDEIISLKASLTEAQNESDSIKSKLKLADANTELLFGKLKEAAAYCYGEGDSPNGDLAYGNKGIESFEELLEKIKKGFKHGETKVEEIKNDMELMKNSLEGAHKKQSFWTIVSSVTTILAAISAAYAVRGH